MRHLWCLFFTCPFNGCPSASSTFFSFNLPQPQTQLTEKLSLLWTPLLRWNCSAALFHPAMPFIFSPLSLCAMITLRTGFDRMGRAHSLSLPHRCVTGTDARILLAVNWELVQPALRTACWSPHVTVAEINQATVPPVRSECFSSALLLSCLQSPVFHDCHSARSQGPLIYCSLPPWKPISQQLGQCLLIWNAYHISTISSGQSSQTRATSCLPLSGKSTTQCHQGGSKTLSVLWPQKMPPDLCKA